MFWTLIGSLTASWLMFMPALWPKDVWRSGVGAAVGLAALPLTILAVGSPRVRRSVAWLGLVLGAGNFFFEGSLGAIASYAVSGILLVGAGMSPMPEPVIQPEIGRQPRPEAPAEPETKLAA